MAKQEPIKQDGEIIEALPNAQFRVKLDNGHEILAHVSGKMRMYYIKILVHLLQEGEVSFVQREQVGNLIEIEEILCK